MVVWVVPQSAAGRDSICALRLHDAKTAVDRVGVEVAWSIAATVQDCKSYKDGMFVAEMNGNFEGGINVSAPLA